MHQPRELLLPRALHHLPRGYMQGTHARLTSSDSSNLASRGQLYLPPAHVSCLLKNDAASLHVEPGPYQAVSNVLNSQSRKKIISYQGERINSQQLSNSQSAIDDALWGVSSDSHISYLSPPVAGAVATRKNEQEQTNQTEETVGSLDVLISVLGPNTVRLQFASVLPIQSIYKHQASSDFASIVDPFIQ